MASVDVDRNLLFGVLAMQADAITRTQFVDACALWASQKERPLADLLVERGWLSPADRDDVEHLIARKLKRHGGNVRASLDEVSGNVVQHSLAEIGDPEVRRSLGLPDAPAGHVLFSTIGYQPETRERYTLTRLHAKGGIGQVWLARDQAFGREVALKELRPERATNSAVWARFVEEARITGQLEHPNIVPVHELAESPEGRRPFYTMRFVKGRTLSEAARAFHTRLSEGKAGPLELHDLLQAFVGVGQAVAYAHSRGVIHRDLKGQNVILGDFGEVIVLDWGLAKIVGQSQETYTPPVAVEHPGERDETVQGQALGTPAYMSPEQAEGRWDEVDARTDVYGLGAILYEVLTGKPPFDGPNTPEVLDHVVHDLPTRPRSLCDTTPPSLEAVCLKALAKRPGDRYASVEDLTADVKRWMADEPVSAYREPLSVRAGRWARRHRPLVAGAAVLLVAAVVGLSVGTVLLSKANARTEAQRLRAEGLRVQAQQNFKKAREAVDEYFTKVSESKLLNVPGLQPLRKELLDAALRYYQGFLKQRGADPSLRAEVGAAYYRVAIINSLLEAIDQARPAMEEARNVYTELTRAHPSVKKYWVDLAICDNDLGRFYHVTYDRPTASRYHHEALEIRKRNALENPGGARFQDELARSYANLANVAMDDGRIDEALKYTEESIAILERVTRGAAPATAIDLPTDLGQAYNSIGMLRIALAGNYARLAYLQRRLGLTDEALESYRDSLKIVAALLATVPEDLSYRNAYASTGTDVCTSLDFMGQADEASAIARKVQPQVERLITENPSVPGYKVNLARLLDFQGLQAFKAGRAREAVPLLRQALSLYEGLCAENPQAAYYQHRVAAGCRHIGLIPTPDVSDAESLALLRRAESLLTKLPNPDTTSIYDLACTQAVIAGRLGREPAAAAERDRYEQQAMDTLRRAISAGYKDLTIFRADTDLDALRPRGDFQALLAGLGVEAPPADPAAPRGTDR